MDQKHAKIDKFIKEGEICYDRDARKAKAECDANEVIEEIQKEQKLIDKEFPNNRIINELSCVFANGPLIWKAGQGSLLNPVGTSEYPGTATAGVFQNAHNLSVNKFDASKSLKDQEARFTALSAKAGTTAKFVTGTRNRDIIQAKAEAVAKAGVVFADGKVCVKVKRKPDGTIYVPGAQLELGKAHARAEAKFTLKSKLLGSKVQLRAGVEAEATAVSVKVGKVKMEEYDNKGVELKAKLQMRGLDVKAGNVHMAKERVGAKAEASVKATGLEVNTGNVSVVGRDNTIQANAEAEVGVKVTAGNVAVVGVGAKGASVRAEATLGIQTGNIQVGIKRRTGASLSTQPQVGNIDLTVGQPTLNMGLIGLNLGIPFVGGGTEGASGDGGTGGGSGDGGTGGTSGDDGTEGVSGDGDTGDDCGNGGTIGDFAESGTVSASAGETGDVFTGDGQTGVTDCGSLAIGDMDGQLIENYTVNADGEFVRSDSDALIVLDGTSEADMDHIAKILNQQNSFNPENSTDSSYGDQHQTHGNYHRHTESIYLDNEEFHYEDEFGKDEDNRYNKRKPSTYQTTGTGESTRDWHGRDQLRTSRGNKRNYSLSRPSSNESSIRPMTNIKESIGNGGSHKPVVFGDAPILKSARRSSQMSLLPNRTKLPNSYISSSLNTNTGEMVGRPLQPSNKNERHTSSYNQRGGASPVTGGSGTRQNRTEILPPISESNGITRPKTANYNEILRKRVVQAVDPNIPISNAVKPVPINYDRDRLKNDILCEYIPSHTKKGNSKSQAGAVSGIGRVGDAGSGNGYSGSNNEKPKRRKEKKKPTGANKNIHTIFTIDDTEDGRPLINHGNFVCFGDD